VEPRHRLGAPAPHIRGAERPIDQAREHLAAIEAHSFDDIDVERKLNGRPRKSLDWRKPSEKMAELVALTG
jgi:hypothetical protein